MTLTEASTNNVIALINNGRIYTAEEAGKAYQEIIQAMSEKRN